MPFSAQYDEPRGMYGTKRSSILLYHTFKVKGRGRIMERTLRMLNILCDAWKETRNDKVIFWMSIMMFMIFVSVIIPFIGFILFLFGYPEDIVTYSLIGAMITAALSLIPYIKALYEVDKQCNRALFR